MISIPSDDQRLLVEAVGRMLAQESGINRVRAAEPGGFDDGLWHTVAEFGLPLLCCPEARGGAGAGLFDAVLIAEAAGAVLAPAPIIESIVANRLLSAALGNLVGPEIEASAPVVLALPGGDGGERQVVPGGVGAAAVLHLVGGKLYLSKASEDTQLADAPIGATLQRLDSATATLVADNEGTAALYARAIIEWRLLLAAQVAAAASAALGMAAVYARERVAFGRPVGSFQGLAHPLADSVSEVDGAALFVRRAATALAAGETGADTLALMAAWWAFTASDRATLRAMRVFGGYGVTLEYDVQLFYRRVFGWVRLEGDPERLLTLAGDRLSRLPMRVEVERAGSLAEAAAAFSARYMTPDVESFLEESEDGFRPDLHRALAAAGLLFPDWPREHGGGDHSALEVAAMQRRLTADGWNGVVTSVTNMAGRLVIEFGSDIAKREILPELANGEAVCCLGYSEPGSGSDLFAARTTAVREGSDWLVNGQKMFTSQAHIARYALLLARTGSADQKHGSLTVFLVPLDRGGFTFQEVKTIDNHRTNVSFFENVRVPDAYRLGPVDGGVRILAAALAIEQGGDEFFPGQLGRLASLARECAAQAGEPGRSAKVSRRVAELTARAHVSRSLADRAIASAAAGQGAKHYGPMAKLFASEAWLWGAADMMSLFAPASQFATDRCFRRLRHAALGGPSATIYAGTSEIQRSLIAESALGLPRSRG